mmetsp:Transcript_16677/g.37496  ORF Transcript_16677/g.37496 Transcript_16677/m.37496 type:complete len:178 (-) Transcript_16677:101-634(-)
MDVYSVAVALVMTVLGFQIIFVSLLRLIEGESHSSQETTEGTDLAVYVAVPSAIIFGAFAVIKLKFGEELSSSSLRKDGYCSSAGAILSFAVILEAIVSEINPTIWWLDPIIAFLVGLVCAFIGFRTLCLRNKDLPLTSISWWLYSHSITPSHQTSTPSDTSSPANPTQETELAEII